jgi:cytochrome c-type biogenesis protein CcmE
MQRIPQTHSTSKNFGKVRFMAGGALIIVAIIALIANGLQMGGNYYLTLDELAAQSDAMMGRGIRVNAAVDKESVVYDSQSITLQFDLVDTATGERRTVVYNDPMPDLFMKSESVIVDGTLATSGTLEAHTILVKCPSKYEEKIEKGEAVPTDHYQESDLQTELITQ